MKVICIWSFIGYSNKKGIINKQHPVYGEIYNVLDKKPGYYKLKEFYHKHWYAEDKFIPLSSIDEIEFIQEYKKELV